MFRYLLRVWLDDRPGALGAVASRIGSVRGDLIGIEILERGAGRAIDELLVELPGVELVDLMVREIMEVDGVDVEDVRLATNSESDGRVGVLKVAKAIVMAKSAESVISILVDHLRSDLEAEWICVVDLIRSEVVTTTGPHPPQEWLFAFLNGTSYGEFPDGGPSDIVWTNLEGTPYKMVIGRNNRPYRSVEREQIIALSEIAGARYQENLQSGRV